MSVLTFPTILSKIFPTLRIIQLCFVINVETSSCEVPVLRVRLYWNLNFLNRFSQEARILNFIKIRAGGAELFHADGQTDGYDEANSRFS